MRKLRAFWQSRSYAALLGMTQRLERSCD
jgi:hypothetical protein